MAAPEPDSQTITEMTANFIVIENHTALLASEEPTEADREKISDK